MSKHRKKEILRMLTFLSNKKEVGDWKLDQDLTKKLSKDVLSHIQEEAKIQFESTVDDINSIRSRAYSFLTILISLLSVLVTLYFSDFLDLNFTDKKTIRVTFVIDVLVVSYSIVQLIIIIFPSKMMLKGTEPKEVAYEALASLDLDSQNDQYQERIIEILQNKIDFNEGIIQSKTSRLEAVIIISSIAFVFTLLLSLILN